ncbi:hypothetical protein SB912_27955, partial [Pantoea sp. SIMBA_072]
DGATQRTAFRGDDAQRAQARDKARASMDRAGMERPAADNRQARQQMREAQAGNSIGNRMQPRGDNARATDRRQEPRNAQGRQVAQNRPANS